VRPKEDGYLPGATPEREVKMAHVGPPVRYRTLFQVFLRAGCAFGGGVSILGILEEELVRARGLIDKREFMAMYAVGRIVPAGTMTALAIAYGHRFRGFLGGLVALAGLLLPGLSLTLAATLGYARLQHSSILPAFIAILLPAAVALVATAALKLGHEVFGQRGPLAIALGALAVGLATDLNPALVLLGGGLVGLLVLRASPERPRTGPNDEGSAP
jgi:chromate transporter